MVGELRASHVIHLHRLLSAVRAEFHDHGMDEDDVDRLREYREHDVAPAEFKATKSEHERALLALSAGLAEWAAARSGDDGDDEAVEVEADTDHDSEVERGLEAGPTR